MKERPYHDIRIYAADGVLVCTMEHIDDEERDALIRSVSMQIGTRIEIVCTCTR